MDKVVDRAVVEVMGISFVVFLVVAIVLVGRVAVVVVIAVVRGLQRGSLLFRHTLIRSFILACWQFPPDRLYTDPRVPSEVAMK